MSEGFDRYAQACLTARIDTETQQRIRLRVDGADWQVGQIGTALRGLTARPRATRDGSGESTIPLTWAMVTQCSKIMEEKGYGWRPDPGLNSWIYDEFMRRHDTAWDEAGALKFDLSSLAWTPMPHQVAGAYVGALNKRFFFCDDLRTGKTRTALLTMAELEARGENPFPAFVVCPASVVDPWMEELDAAFPDWPATVYRGPKRRRLSSRYMVYVMSWNTFRDDMHARQTGHCPSGTVTELTRELEKAFSRHHMAPETYSVPLCSCCRQPMTLVDVSKTRLPPLLEFGVPRTLVLDEAHGLCNVKTRQSVAARRCARVAEFAFPMSGTPITRDVGGFWSALNVLDIRSFPDQDRYKDRYTDRYHSDYAEEIDGLSPQTRDEFHLLMQGSMRRIAKTDVNPDLLPPCYSTRVVQIPPAYRAAYDEMAKDMIAHLPDGDEPLEVMSTLAQLQRLTQLASSSCDVEVRMERDDNPDSLTCGEDVPRYHVTMQEPSWKVDELMEIMTENQGSPLITFSPHTQLVKMAGARAEAAGYRVGYIVGGQSHGQRSRVRLAYQNGELDLLCANVTAGGVGLTLNRGDTVIFLERPWAYWQASQAEARADDVMKAKQIYVIDIVAASSVESRVREALKGKSRQLAELVRDPRIVESFLGGQPVKVLLPFTVPVL